VGRSVSGTTTNSTCFALRLEVTRADREAAGRDVLDLSSLSRRSLAHVAWQLVLLNFDARVGPTPPSVQFTAATPLTVTLRQVTESEPPVQARSRGRTEFLIGGDKVILWWPEGELADTSGSSASEFSSFLKRAASHGLR
jgi:hypothetical protein